MTDIKLYDYPTAMTPLFPEKGEMELRELAFALIKKSSYLSGLFNRETRLAIAKLVEPMNSYYSNLIEGHNTHPLDIEKALKRNYSLEPKKKMLQLESYAHVMTDRLMKEEMKENKNPYEVDFIRWIHKEFYNYMPGEYKIVKTDTGRDLEIIPGALRETQVAIGRHIPPVAESLPRFMDFFEEGYSRGNDSLKKIIGIAASHHRLAWIHPFLDGNGRVTRLFSEAALIRENVDSEGLWSISRGLAKNNKNYYALLANADHTRLNDYDGRGNLSDRYLYDFCKFFLETCIDQVDYMLSLIEPENLLGRIGYFTTLMVSRGELKEESRYVLESAIFKGKIMRGDLPHLTGKSDNVARGIMNDLLEMELLVPESDAFRSSLKINFPIRYAPYIFPKLFPSDIEATML